MLQTWPNRLLSPYYRAADAAGLVHIPSVLYKHVNEGLVRAFVERWNPETNSFHFPIGEMSIGLHDVKLQMQLRIAGKNLGVPIDLSVKGKKEVMQKKLKDAEYALGIPCDKGGCSHAELRERAQEPNGLSGPTRVDCKKISTCYTLILSWIYAYFPKFRPAENPTWDVSQPYALRWAPKKDKGTERNYRQELDRLTVHDIDWFPYGQQLDYRAADLAPALYKGVLSCGAITEPYMPDHFMRQFGFVQRIPTVFIPAIKAWRFGNPKSYVVDHNLPEYQWNAEDAYRWTVEQFGQRTLAGYECEPGYLAWYMPRTHPFIERPSVDEYRNVINTVMGFIGPYYDPSPRQFDEVKNVVQSSIDWMRPYHNRGYY